jgi:hypothetical protein
MDLYTAESVRQSLAPKWDTYYAKLAVGQPPNWKCDETTKQNFCLSQWMIDECNSLGCSQDVAHNLLRGFNRNARSSYDLYQTMADVMNTYVNGDIVNYDGMRRH